MHQRLRIVQNGQARESSKSEPLRHGAEGNEQTLRYAALMVREDSSQDDRVRDLATQLVSNCAFRDAQCEVGKLFEFARDRIRYVEDPIDTERIADAWRTFEKRAGDCVDKAILLATLLGSLGYHSRFIVQSFDGDLSDGYDHVHLQVLMNGEWVDLDPTPERAPVGWAASSALRAGFEIWPGANHPQDARATMSGPFDSILPTLIQTGVQFGSAFALGQIQQSRASGQQGREIGAAWDQLVQQANAEFRAAWSVEPPDVGRAVAAYQALEIFVSQYGTQYVVEQWHSEHYKPAFEATLNKMLAQANAVAPQTGTLALANQQNNVPAGNQQSVFAGISPWAIAAVALLFLVVRK